uniref:Uncharacterized protein n=1 Tax=Ciona savignyi TaxID=51511 RepID=H2YTA6_CIOSA
MQHPRTTRSQGGRIRLASGRPTYIWVFRCNVPFSQPDIQTNFVAGSQRPTTITDAVARTTRMPYKKGGFVLHGLPEQVKFGIPSTFGRKKCQNSLVWSCYLKGMQKNNLLCIHCSMTPAILKCYMQLTARL